MPKGVYDRKKEPEMAEVEAIKVVGLRSGEAVLSRMRGDPIIDKKQKKTIAQVVGKMPEDTKFFPVKLNKGYRPIDKFKRLDEDGNMVDPPELNGDQDKGLYYKLMPGETYALPMPEAKELIARGLATRADALPE